MVKGLKSQACEVTNRIARIDLVGADPIRSELALVV